MTQITIGYDPDFAPISFTIAGGEGEGRAIALLRETCAAADVACGFVPVVLADQEEALHSGKVDALAAMAVTPERKRRFDLSAPYLVTGAAWFALEPFDPERSASIVTPASGPLVRIVAERWPHLAVLPATGYREALELVAGGEAAAAALNFDAGSFICERDFGGRFVLPQSPFLEIPLALACLKGRRTRELQDLYSAMPVIGVRRRASGPSRRKG